MAKPLIYLLTLLILITQYRLWWGENGLIEYYQLHQRVEWQEAENSLLRERNERLSAEVLDLKGGLEALDERARFDLGMIGANDVFYWLIGEAPAVFSWPESPENPER